MVGFWIAAFVWARRNPPNVWCTLTMRRVTAHGNSLHVLQAEEILNTANKVSSDRMAGFYRYTNEFSEMVYNPASKEV